MKNEDLKMKRRAFTLAEVLITLTIIGVVAAMTLPVLIQNHQKAVWVKQLQKTYSVLEQGFQLMMADEGVDSLYDIPAFTSANYYYHPACDGSLEKSSDKEKCGPVFELLTKYFKGSYGTFGQGTTYLGIKSAGTASSRGSLNMPDDTQIRFYFYKGDKSSLCSTIKSLGGHMCVRIADVEIDINGGKGPNTYGKDWFNYSISDTGKLYPQYGKDQALFITQQALSSNGNYWRNDSSKCGTPGSPDIAGVTGYGCAARIMENGWNIDYNVGRRY